MKDELIYPDGKIGYGTSSFQGKSLSSLSSLLSDAGGCGLSKLSGSHQYIWTFFGWIAPGSQHLVPEAFAIWSSRPLKTSGRGGCKSDAKNIDIYRLQEELVERGLYSKIFSQPEQGTFAEKGSR